MNGLQKLRIFIYGKNALHDIEYLNPNIDKKYSQNKKNGINHLITIDRITKWEYFIFQGEINHDRNEVIKSYLEEHYKQNNYIKLDEKIRNVMKYKDADDRIFKEIADLKLKYIHFYDVLIISIDNLLDDDCKLAFNFFQDFTYVKNQQPFILFLTKKDNNPNVIDLFKYITNEYYDKRNVFAYKFPTNEEEIENIHKFFIKCMNYYHELGNDNKKQDSKFFNILICGPSGTGKSTFINQILHEKLAKEGGGIPTTNGINCYYHQKYPIRIYDTKGLESDDSIKFIGRTIEKYENELNLSNKIDLILYFKELKKKGIFAFEIEFLKCLMRKKKVIFVLNDFQTHSKRDRISIMDIYKDTLKKISETMSKYDTNLDNIDNIILIKLKQEIYDDNDDGGVVVGRCYGIDKLFDKIFKIFMEDKISIHDIENSIDIGELKKNVEKFELLEKVKYIEDIHINCKIEASKLILSYSNLGIFEPFFRDSKRKELLKEINKIYNKNSYQNNEDIDRLFLEIEKKIKDIKDKKAVINEFFHSIKRLKGYFNTEGFNFDAYWYNETTLLFGYLYLKEFDVEYGEYDEKTKKYLKEYSCSLNEAIDGFQELSKEWEDTYKSLKSHQSDKEWVNRFFIVDLPNLKVI